MGMNLQLYASKRISLEEAQVWCNCKAFEAFKVPTRVEQLIVDKVNQAMRFDSRSGPDVLEHCLGSQGVATFSFLDAQAHLCDDALAERAKAAGRDTNQRLRKDYPDTYNARLNWENDDAVHFLKAHIGYVVWGFSD